MCLSKASSVDCIRAELELEPLLLTATLRILSRRKHESAIKPLQSIIDLNDFQTLSITLCNFLTYYSEFF